MTVQLILEFVVALVTLVIIHELGHFIACKLFKVEVEEFGLGLPSPNPIVLFRAGGTRFTFNWLLLGGFVRPKGENDPSVPGGLAAARPWVRIGVFLAGPLMNLLVGVLLYATIYLRYGLPSAVTEQVQIMSVAPKSPAMQAGIQACDTVESVNGEKIDNLDTLHNIIYANLDQPILLAYRHGEQVVEATVVPRSNPPAGEGAIGIGMGNPIQFSPSPWYKALPNGLHATYNYIHELLALPVRLIRRQANPAEGRLVGFKGMYDIYADVRQNNTIACTPRLLNVIGFYAAITLSLGLLNLLPIPALDGGQILFILPEILFRRRIPPQYAGWINAIFLMLLIFLMLFINLQDFINPFEP
jgi:regulator of sigma E protease